MNKLITFTVLLILPFNHVLSETNWITKKKSTNQKKIEKIENQFANGIISKAQCVSKKSKLLNLKITSKTICDNVKVVKKNDKDLEESISIEKIKKDLENNENNKNNSWISKKKKEIYKIEKELSNDAKSWITKKKKDLKKEKKHKITKNIADLPKSSFYFYAWNDIEEVIGYGNPDKKSSFLEIDDLKFRKGTEGKAFFTRSDLSCSIYSEVGKALGNFEYSGSVTMICENGNEFFGSWRQKNNKGRGIASSEDLTTALKFIFSSDREFLVASKNNINKQKPYLPKKNQDLDQIKPIIKVAKKMTISETTILKGKVTDNKSIEALYINGNSVNFDNNGNFKFVINPNKIKDNIIILEAYDGSGNLTTENVSVELIAKKYKSDQNYYAIVIGNNDYKFLTPLQAAKNDAQEIARILKNKYKFKVIYKPDADEDTMIDTIHNLSRKLTDKDNLLIYYAGHGELDENTNKGYFLPIDAKANKRSTWISNDFIRDEALATKARHVLLIADSCFAGSLMRSVDTNKTNLSISNDKIYLKKMEKKKSRRVIASGGNEEVIDSLPGENHSLFAKKLIEILNNSQTVFNTSDIFEDIRRYVANNAKQAPEQGKLYGTGDDGGDFFFFPIN